MQYKTNRKIRVYRFLLLFALVFATATAADAAEPIFVTITNHAATVDGGLSRGVAFGDADGDGDADLLVANTINYPEFLYRNDKDRFVQVMEAAPSLAGGFTEGVSWIDFDNDGDLDIFAARTSGPNALYRNDGGWSFVEHTAGSLSEDRSASSMACWADVDNDGWLDVFVVNRGGESDVIHRNRNGRFFEQVTDDIISRVGGDGRSCVFGDFDGDGDPDLYVGNFVDTSTKPPSRQRNFLYFNQGDFRFTENRVDESVAARALTYGTSAIDADNDGDLDLFVTNIGKGDENQLYLNDGNGSFRLHDAGLSTTVSTPSKGHTWGDFDLDGDVDVAIANGTEGTEHVHNELYLNDGLGNFVVAGNGDFLTDTHISAGIAWADIDEDGDLDLFVANWGNGDEDNTLYENQSHGNWLKLSLTGSESNRMAVGARVTITTRHSGKTKRQVRWLDTSTGYASQNEPILHFGLGAATNVATLSIDWPSGQREELREIAANQHLRIREGDT